MQLYKFTSITWNSRCVSFIFRKKKINWCSMIFHFSPITLSLFLAPNCSVDHCQCTIPSSLTCWHNWERTLRCFESIICSGLLLTRTKANHPQSDCNKMTMSVSLSAHRWKFHKYLIFHSVEPSLFSSFAFVRLLMSASLLVGTSFHFLCVWLF